MSAKKIVQQKNKVNHYEIPVQEMKRMYAGQLAGIDGIKTTIRSVFSAASLIVSLFGALQVFTANIAPGWESLYYTLLTSALVAYIAFIVICIAGMWPVYIHPPLYAVWDTLADTFKNLTPVEADAMYVSCILQAIDLNKPIVQRFARLERAALFLLPVIVVLVLCLGFIPRA